MQGGAASGVDSFAAGPGALAARIGKEATSAGIFAVAGDAQKGCMKLRGITTNNTPLVISADAGAAAAGNQVTLPNDSTYTFSALIVARRTDADGESAGYKIEGVIDRNGNAASTALVGSPTVTVLGEDTAGWDVAVTANTTLGCLTITVTGENAKTIQWVAVVNTVETTG